MTAKITRGNGRMITTGQNTLNTENISTVEAQRVGEESLHPSTNHTRANVHV